MTEKKSTEVTQESQIEAKNKSEFYTTHSTNQASILSIKRECIVSESPGSYACVNHSS